MLQLNLKLNMYTKITLGFITAALSLGSQALAKNLKDYTPYEYDVRFTNPVCAEYKYDSPVLSNSGDTLTAKPKNAYCKNSDEAASAAQSEAPIKKLLSWINDKNTKEIFFTYLSFSNDTVLEALCSAIEKRDVKVRFVLDSESGSRAAAELLKCKSLTAKNHPEFFPRGHVPGIGFAHNKIFIINPNSKNEVKIAFGSANMTSGVVLHHENWHFITTHAETYFAQSHFCVTEAEIHHADSGAKFKSFMKTCLSEIDNAPEEDIQAFYIPGDGAKATEAIRESLAWASEVKIAAHRFSYTTLMKMLKEHLANNDFKLKLLFDDDMYWAGEKFAKNRPNVRAEYKHVAELIGLGAETKYLETNYNHKLLHHNKFIIFESPERSAAFVGAGNFTGTAFTENFENFYFVQIPEVIEKLNKQYSHLYNKLATSEENLPEKDISP